MASTVLLVVLGAAHVFAAPVCLNLTGWWNGRNAMEQRGDNLTVTAGTVGYGTTTGYTITFFFANRGGKPLKGSLSKDCTTISWENQAVWSNRCPDPEGHLAPYPRLCGSEQLCCPVGQKCVRSDKGLPTCGATPNFTKIHVVYMTHFDMGFTDTTRNVCDTYFDSYFPAAWNTSNYLRARGGPEQFAWTEFPWIIQEYLDGAAGCAHRRRTQAEVAAMESAIRNESIIWHANAVNFLTEVLDPVLWNYSLSMRTKLNHRFGKQWGSVAGKLTDTTGMSRSAIPTLAQQGVKAWHIGYNGVGGLPAVPSTFMWKHPETGTELLTMIEDNYGTEIDVPPMAEASIVHSPKQDVALVFLYTLDNTGPPTAEAVIAFWKSLQARHPTAAIVSSSIDAFAREVLESISPGDIPTYSDELGDSWLYGAPADAVKVATFREARRSLNKAVKEGRVDPSSPMYDSYMRRLMKGPCEHNWGLSIGQYLPELRTPHNWKNDEFAAVRPREDYQRLEWEWAEQREWMHPLPTWSSLYGWSHNSAANPSVVNPTASAMQSWDRYVMELESALAPLIRPPAPPMQGRALPTKPSPVKCKGYTVTLSESGAVVSLVDPKGRDWASPSNPLGDVAYQTFSKGDFDLFAQEYAAADFGKAGVEEANPQSGFWSPTPLGTVQAGECSFITHLAFRGTPHTYYGAPGDLYLNVTVPGSGGAMADITLSWFNKTATRLPEALWLSFVPKADPSEHWMMDVMGHDVDPLSVAEGGTRFKHAVWEGVRLLAKDNTQRLLLRFIDTNLVSPGDRNHLLRFCRAPGWGQRTGDCQITDPIKGGMHANLFNNLWGTAFPQWYDDDGLARFQLVA